MGASFTDCLGRGHDLKIVVSHLRFLRERGFDLSRPTDAITRVDELMVSEPEKVVEVLYRVRWEPPPLTPEEFVEGFDGPTLWRAACALSHAIIDFFPSPTVAERLRSALERVLTPTPDPTQTETPTASSATATRPPESAEPTPEGSASVS